MSVNLTLPSNRSRQEAEKDFRLAVSAFLDAKDIDPGRAEEFSDLLNKFRSELILDHGLTLEELCQVLDGPEAR